MYMLKRYQAQEVETVKSMLLHVCHSILNYPNFPRTIKLEMLIFLLSMHFFLQKAITERENNKYIHQNIYDARKKESFQ